MLPTRIPLGLYWRSCYAVLAAGAAIGAQWTAVSMVALGPLAEPVPARELTRVGLLNVRPEYDLPAYYAGCATTLLLLVALVWGWSRLLARPWLPRPERTARIGAGLHAGVAAASLLVFLRAVASFRGAFDDAWRLPLGEALRLAAPGLAALAAIALYHLYHARPRR